MIRPKHGCWPCQNNSDLPEQNYRQLFLYLRLVSLNMHEQVLSGQGVCIGYSVPMVSLKLSSEVSSCPWWAKCCLQRLKSGSGKSGGVYRGFRVPMVILWCLQRLQSSHGEPGGVCIGYQVLIMILEVSGEVSEFLEVSADHNEDLWWDQSVCRSKCTHSKLEVVCRGYIEEMYQNSSSPNVWQPINFCLSFSKFTWTSWR